MHSMFLLFYSFLCFERNQFHSKKNIAINLGEIVKVRKVRVSKLLYLSFDPGIQFAPQAMSTGLEWPLNRSVERNLPYLLSFTSSCLVRFWSCYSFTSSYLVRFWSCYSLTSSYLVRFWSCYPVCVTSDLSAELMWHSSPSIEIRIGSSLSLFPL